MKAEDVIYKELEPCIGEAGYSRTFIQNLAIEIVSQLRAAGLLSEWVSVEERLPDEGRSVLFVDRKGGIFTGWYSRDFIGSDYRDFFYVNGTKELFDAGNSLCSTTGVTHWQAIAPPKE